MAADDDSWRECDRVYTNEKAGMAQVDKDFVKKTIYEMSKDSEHFKNEQRKQLQLERRIERLKQTEATLTPDRINSLTRSIPLSDF